MRELSHLVFHLKNGEKVYAKIENNAQSDLEFYAEEINQGNAVYPMSHGSLVAIIAREVNYIEVETVVDVDEGWVQE